MNVFNKTTYVFFSTLLSFKALWLLQKLNAVKDMKNFKIPFKLNAFSRIALRISIHSDKFKKKVNNISLTEI